MNGHRGARRARVLTAGLAVALLAPAGCSGRANNLYTYYDDPTTTAPAGPTASARATPRGAPPTTPPAALAANRARQVLLTAAELAVEEVAADPAPPPEPSAGASACPGSEPVASATANWRYGTGSTLRQHVAAYPDPTAAAALDCPTDPTDPADPPDDAAPDPAPTAGVDTARTWCAEIDGRGSCTVLLVRGDLVTTITVEAATTRRARQAVDRVAGLAATALARD